MPLSIVQTVGSTRPVPAGFHLNELATEGRSFELPRRDWTALLFQQIDRALKIWAAARDAGTATVGDSGGGAVDAGPDPV